MNEHTDIHPIEPASVTHEATVQSTQVVPTKDKTVAVLLAVFLGFWTWLYTYKKDNVKFWINVGITAGLVILILPTLTLTLFLLPFWCFASWLWAVIDVATKPSVYYWNFYRD